MRVAEFVEPGSLSIVTLADPTPGPDDVVIAIEACGVCGSDLASYFHGHYVVPGQVLGHEISGRVAELGANLASSSGLRVGDRVAVKTARACEDCYYCRAGSPQLCGDSGRRSFGYGTPGGFADVIVLDHANVAAEIFRMDGPTALDVMWTEPLAVAVHAVRRGLVAPDSDILVVGGGSVGLCIVAAARAMGVRSITVSEPSEDRRAAAARIGADAAAPESLPTLGPWDIAFDTSGVASAIAAAMRHLRAGGRIVCVGLGDSPMPEAGGPVEVVASFAYTDADFRDAAALVASGAVALGSHVSISFPLAQINDAFTASKTDRSVVKMAIVP
jgi:2-desacetyl-2-hydroxyethyl bacteriochlorophyllide A dehydrogenase